VSFAGLNYQNWTMRFTAGLGQKTDERSLEAPELARAVDVQFDEIGGIQTRYPFTTTGMSINIYGGGEMADIRRVEPGVGGELLCFTKTALYSWNAQLAAWVLKGTHLAVKVEESSQFITADDQVDCDRAELNNTIVYSWVSGTTGYVAAVDKETGSVLMPPIAISGAVSRMRLTTCTARILLTYSLDAGTPGLYGYSIDPASPITAIQGISTVITFTNWGTYYDIVRLPGESRAAFVARQSPATSYVVGLVTENLASVTLSVKARTCDGPIALSVDPVASSIQVARTVINGAGPDKLITGDLLTVSSLADVYINQAIGTAPLPNGDVSRIAMAHRSVQDSGAYRCYVYWSYNYTNTPDGGSGTRYNWVDTANTVGPYDTLFKRELHPASRAFDHDGSVYVQLAYDTYCGAGVAEFPLQSSVFLFRDDGFLVAKQLMHRAHSPNALGWLPGVQLTNTGVFSWCGTVTRKVASDIAAVFKRGLIVDRAPVDITLTFDSNDARRCARAGETLYIACGEGLLQYDGVRLVETGFHYFPAYFDYTENAGGSIADGSYGMKLSFRYENGRGESERSTTATIATVPIVSGPSQIDLTNIQTLIATHKAEPSASVNVAIEVWRTAVNPTDDAPFYLVSGSDPQDTTGSNCFVFNTTSANTVTFTDGAEDADITSGETHPEDGGILESLPPPPCTLIAASDTRLFLAGVAGDPHRVWYSKPRSPGFVAAFHDALVAQVPQTGGDITALAFMDGTLVVFREHALYAMLGEGFDSIGAGQNYVARAIPGNVGAVNAESVVETDKGIIFKSSKGWYLLNRGYSLEYIGAGVADYDTEEPLSAHFIEAQHQVRILTASRMLVFDTLVGQWCEWSVSGCVSSCLWNGTHVAATSALVKQQQTDHSGTDYGIDVETAWIKLADLVGYKCIDELHVLGECRGAHRLKVRLARDYWKDGVDSYFQTKSWAPSPTVVGGRLQVRHRPAIRQVEAIKIRLTAVGTADETPWPSSEALKLTGLVLRVGVQPGTYRNLTTAQKQ
jgi:hypothetical protein